jgi:hypothetical protein
MRHMRAARFCRRGVQTFFDRHGLDWRSFLSEGIEAEKLEATCDTMALEVVRIAREEQEEV